MDDGPLVLVGAPGAGKTTVGLALADRVGVAFADVDAVIVDRVGKPIAEIFADDGEPAFRALEEQVTAELLAPGGPGVLALGGGAVLSPVTRAALQDVQAALDAGHAGEDYAVVVGHLADEGRADSY